MRRIAIFGWGIVAPRSPNIDSFLENLEEGESWLQPFEGFGPSNFLVGQPEFDFGAYKEWIDKRFRPNRYSQLKGKMDESVLFSVGAFIQALGQNEILEKELQKAGMGTHIYVGTGLGSIPTIYQASIDLLHAQRRWNRFWAEARRNDALANYLNGKHEEPAPPHPETVEEPHREQAEEDWWSYWASRSHGLREYLEELREIESLAVEGNVESGKLRLMKEKRRRKSRLQEKWGAPEPPWTQVTPNVLWNISNISSSQISMLGQICGPSFGTVAACSSFGVSLKMGMDAIQRGEAKYAVIGASDASPHALTVGGFYGARVIAADGEVSKPLTELRGTHVAGGSSVWIIGDYEEGLALGMKPLGMEPVSVGITSDADHIITPSKEGPSDAIRMALRQAGIQGKDVGTWDLHATATPGDYLEVENLRDILPGSVLVTARKGIFGHGMAAAGGWELTAQYLGYERGKIPGLPLTEADLNPQIREVHQNFLFDEGVEPPVGAAGKLSMGIGGINACVISKPW